MLNPKFNDLIAALNCLFDIFPIFSLSKIWNAASREILADFNKDFNLSITFPFYLSESSSLDA